MPGKRKVSAKKRAIEQYEHKDKDRVNNPQVGLDTPDTEKDEGKKRYGCNQNLDTKLLPMGETDSNVYLLPKSTVLLTLSLRY